MSFEVSLEEKKTQILIELRGYKLISRTQLKDYISFIVETRDGTKVLVWSIPTKGTVGVAYINQMSKVMNESDVENAIIISSGRYTQAAKTNSKKNNIELIPRTFPAFNIFNHVLVPKHEILSNEERNDLLKQYRVKPYQLPKIRESDPAVMAIGAKAGDIVRILRESQTAGTYTSYRYVIDD